MAKALKIAAVVAAVAAVTIVTGGAAAGLSLSLGTSVLGVSAGALLTASTLLSAGSSLLSPKPKAPDASAANAARLQVQINLRTCRVIAFGSTALATDLRDQEFTQDGTYLHRFLVVASHRVHAIREIWFDDKLAWTVAGGAQGEFAQWLQVTPILEGSAGNAIYVSPRMGLSRRYTGLAYVYLKYTILAHSKKLDSPFATAVPSRVTIIGDGAAIYDPRLDSTVPGGSGPMRADDQTTWAWNDSAARNPALQILFFLLGWRIQNPQTGAWKLVVGKGMPPARIDLASFITAANLCDEPVAIAAGGTEPRYRSDGVFSEGDDPQTVLDNLKAAANATLDDMDGRVRITVLHNDLATPIGELETGDVLGAFQWNQTPQLSDCINVIRGGYTDPSTASLYQIIDGPEQRSASIDGIDRIQTVNLPVVQSVSQWQRLVKQRLQRMQFGGTFSAVFQQTAWKFAKNDVIRLTFAPLGWYQKLFRIAELTVQYDGTVPMVLREEDPAIYAHDNTDGAAIIPAEPAVYDPTLWPILAGIVDVDTRLGQVLSDNVITAGREKREIVRDWSSLESEFNATEAQWQALGSPGDVAAAESDARAAVTALASTLANLTPAWDDVTQDTPVDGAGLNAQWIAARDRVEKFAAAIQGRKGADGASAYNLILTNETHTVPADHDGNVTSYAGTTTTLQVYYGATDVTAQFALGPTANPQNLSIPGSYPTYSVDGGFDLGEDVAEITFEVDGTGPHAGVILRRKFTLTKSKAAEDGKSPPLISIGASSQQLLLNPDDSLAADAQPFVFTARRQNMEAGTVFSFDPGHATVAPGVTIDGDTMTVSAARMRDMILYDRDSAGLGASVGVIAAAGGLIDRITVVGLKNGARGADAPLVRTQWSVNGVDGWHDNYFGADVYARQSNDNGATWGPAYRAIGEAGTIGDDGTSPSIVFTRSPTVPATPTDNSGNPPAGWSDGPPGGTDLLWQSKATFKGAQQLTSWSAPVRITGDAGTPGTPGSPGAPGSDALLLAANVSSLAFQADYLGNPKSGQLAQTIKFTLTKGGADISGAAGWTAEFSGCAGAIDANGLVQFSAVTADGYVRVGASYGGATLTPVKVPTKLAMDNAPPTTDTNASTGISGIVDNPSFDATPDASTITTVTTGTLRGALSLLYDPTARGNTYVTGAVAYRVAGSNNAWTFFSAGAVQGSQARIGGTAQEPINEQGGLYINQTQGVSNGRYEVGGFLRWSAGGQTADASGTLQAKDG